MRAKVETGRRFEIMRLVADHIVASAEDRLLPATKAKTDRQKFQRAFSQEFLLPFDELYHRLDQPRRGENEISDDDIDDVAREYIVSPLMVRTVLVNQGFLPREVLPATV
jgi:Zn-dependent peptidase ImmA (M78 family)